MPIPDIPNFRRLLETFTVEEPKNIQDHEMLSIVNESHGSDKSEKGKRIVVYPEIKIWYKPSTELSIDSLLTKIQKELALNNHPNTQSISRIIFGIAVLHRKFQQEPIECLNQILTNITSAEMIQIFVYPEMYSLKDKFSIKGFELGDFCISGLNSNKLKHLCRKVGSDFYDKYSEEFSHRLVIERSKTKINVFNFISLHNLLSFPVFIDKLRPDSSFMLKMELLDRLMGEYFYELSSYYKKSFWNLMLEQQHLLISYGAPYFDIEPIQMFHNSQFITIFLGFDGKENIGWVEPSSSRAGLDFARADERIPLSIESLKNDFNFTEFRKSDIHQTIKSFSLFVSKAKRHCLKNNHDEGFLHYIIALDLLLGEKGASTKSVTDRTAILVYRKFGKSFSEQQKEIGNFYDIRSKYVHAGVSVKTESIKEIESICEEVLRCLLRLQMQPANHIDGFIKTWIRNLDFLVKAVEADKEQEKSAYLENGIWYDKP